MRGSWSSLVRQHHGQGIWCKFNLIPFNPFPGIRLAALAAGRRCRLLRKILSDAGIVTTVRKTRGDDIDAACGQLAGDVKDRTSVRQAHGAAAHRDAATGQGNRCCHQGDLRHEERPV